MPRGRSLHSATSPTQPNLNSPICFHDRYSLLSAFNTLSQDFRTVHRSQQPLSGPGIEPDGPRLSHPTITVTLMSVSRSSPPRVLDDEERQHRSPSPSAADKERSGATPTRTSQRPSSSSSAFKGGFAQWTTSSSLQSQPSEAPSAKPPRTRPQRSRDATGTTTATASTEDSAGSSDEDSDELDDDEYRQERALSTSSVVIPPDQQLLRSELYVMTRNSSLEASLTHHSVYALEVIQQPQRARACGFGDKVSSVVISRPQLTGSQDRRPLSPPPIIQLRIFDKLGNAIKPQCVAALYFLGTRPPRTGLQLPS